MLQNAASIVKQLRDDWICVAIVETWNRDDVRDDDDLHEVYLFGA